MMAHAWWLVERNSILVINDQLNIYEEIIIQLVFNVWLYIGIGIQTKVGIAIKY